MTPKAITDCQAKKRYETKEKAQEVSDGLWADKMIDLSVYRCSICEGYHLTSRKA